MHTGTMSVLLCFDGSGAAAQAIRSAARLFSDHDALVLSVAIPAKDEWPLDPLGDLVGRLSGLYREWDELARELAQRRAELGCQIATEVGFRAAPLIAAGKPAPTILHVADEHDVSAIIMGTRGHRSSLSIGSVSAHVAQQARRPVLIVAAPDEQGDR
jgi:nucleotide-binding universal stress UspA family protein